MRSRRAARWCRDRSPQLGASQRSVRRPQRQVRHRVPLRRGGPRQPSGQPRQARVYVAPCTLARRRSQTIEHAARDRRALRGDRAGQPRCPRRFTRRRATPPTLVRCSTDRTIRRTRSLCPVGPRPRTWRARCVRCAPPSQPTLPVPRRERRCRHATTVARASARSSPPSSQRCGLPRTPCARHTDTARRSSGPSEKPRA
ncbi:MAG: hypothetical protein RIT23_696 [Actinomycetota bacterium]